jgi:hypothetical protein
LNIFKIKIINQLQIVTKEYHITFVQKSLVMPNLEKYLQTIIDNIVAYAPNLVDAIAVLIIGFWAANKLEKAVI